MIGCTARPLARSVRVGFRQSIRFYSSPASSGPITPAAQFLIGLHDLSSESVEKIVPSGPGGRVLKADVLAFVGSVKSEYVQESASRIANAAKLDLSNIKLRVIEAKVENVKVDVVEVDEVEVKKRISMDKVVELQVRLGQLLGSTIETDEMISRAIETVNEECAIEGIDREAGRKARLGIDDLMFDDLVSTPSVQTVFIPDIVGIKSTKPTKPTETDLFDDLVGVPRSSGRARRVETATTDGNQNVFLLRVEKTKQAQAEQFLSRLQHLLEREPGRVVL